MSNIFSFNAIESNSFNEFGEHLYDILKPILDSNRNIIFLCIGSDKSTGDSLGPLVGYNINNFDNDSIYIYGSLYSPVHSQNLLNTLEDIKNSFENPYIVAIDASLGSFQNVGKVFIEDTPLLPGLALDKKLPAVGDLSITGVVNISGDSKFMVLQTTRLYTVFTLAEFISKGISYSIDKLIGKNLFIESLSDY